VSQLLEVAESGASETAAFDRVESVIDTYLASVKLRPERPTSGVSSWTHLAIGRPTLVSRSRYWIILQGSLNTPALPGRRYAARSIPRSARVGERSLQGQRIHCRRGQSGLDFGSGCERRACLSKSAILSL
jgi:hypothetical protein